jgi:hypothetical protein
MRSGRNRHHLHIQAKAAREGFGLEVRFVATGLTEEQAIGLEVERIAFWRATGVKLVNLTAGGDGLRNPSLETRQKLSELARRRSFSEATRQKMRERSFSEATRQKMALAKNGHKRRPHSAETKQKMSLVAKGLRRGPLSEETKRKLSQALMGHPGAKAFLGKTHSEEARGKMRAAALGRTYSEEVREKMRAAKLTDEAKERWKRITRLGPKARMRPVICLDDGKVYESVSAAARAYRVTCQEINRSLRFEYTEPRQRPSAARREPSPIVINCP